jgi:hypothetical protein
MTAEKNEPSDNPQTLEEWLWRIRLYEKQIFVRERKKNGEDGFETVALSDVYPERWAYWVSRWLQEGAIPVRFKGGTDDR